MITCAYSLIYSLTDINRVIPHGAIMATKNKLHLDMLCNTPSDFLFVPFEYLRNRVNNAAAEATTFEARIKTLQELSSETTPCKPLMITCPVEIAGIKARGRDEDKIFIDLFNYHVCEPRRLSFFVPGKPRPGGSKRAFRHAKTGRIIVADSSKHVMTWRTQVEDRAITAMDGRSPMSGPVELQLTFHRARPKSHEPLGHYAPMYPTSKPDATKLTRSTEDALTGITWHDDSKVVTQRVHKIYAPARLEGAEIVIKKIIDDSTWAI